MSGAGKESAVLQLWELSEAPAEFQQAFAARDLPPNSWIAHIPVELQNEPLIDLLYMHFPFSEPYTALLSDGSKLLACPPSDLPGEDSQQLGSQWRFDRTHRSLTSSGEEVRATGNAVSSHR